MQATAAAIIQVKKELLAENPDIEQDPNFKSIVVDRVLVNLGERAPGEVTLPVVAKPKATKPSPLDVPEYHTAPERVYDTITGAGQALADGVKSITNNGVTFPKPKKDEPTVVAAQPKATAASATAAKKDFDDADKEARAALAKFRAAKPGTTEYKEAKAALDRAGRKRALAGQKMQQALGEPTDAPVQKDTTTAGPTPAELTQGAINTGAATAAVGATNAIAELPAVREKVVKLLDGMIATDHFAEINTQMEQKYVDFVASVNAAPSTEVRTALKAADKEATRLAKENERVAGIKRELAAGDVSNRVALQKQLKVAVEDSLETEARMQRNLALARSIYTLATGRR